MTVQDLIKQFQTMPQNLEVAMEIELTERCQLTGFVQDIVVKKDYHDKQKDIDTVLLLRG